MFEMGRRKLVCYVGRLRIGENVDIKGRRGVSLVIVVVVVIVVARLLLLLLLLLDCCCCYC